MSYWLENDAASDDDFVAPSIGYLHIHDDGTSPHPTAITVLTSDQRVLHVPGQFNRQLSVRCLDCRKVLLQQDRILLRVARVTSS